MARTSIVFNPLALHRPIAKGLQEALHRVAEELERGGHCREGGPLPRECSCLLADRGEELLGILTRIGSERWDQLSARERQVAILAGRGLSNRGIARKLGIQPATVAVYVRRAYAKLAITSRILLAQYSLLEAARSWPAIEP